MPSDVARIELNTTVLDALHGFLPERADAILDKIAFDVLGGAQRRANVETGAMRASGYVSGTSGGGTYQQSVADARSRRPKTTTVHEVKPEKSHERVVGFSVNYAFWVHVKHNPFLSESVEEQKPRAEQAWKGLFD